VFTFHERHFYTICTHGVPAHVEAEHEVRVSELGAHASDTRKLLHGRKFGCHFMNGIFTSDRTEPSKNVTCHSEGSMSSVKRKIIKTQQRCYNRLTGL